MENFTIYNPTKLFFGKDVVKNLGKTVNPFGKKALFVYGGGSIKRNGAYDQVVNQLQSNNIQILEYSGIKSNPLIEDVDIASKIARKAQVDFIVAVGGGSVIDSAKIMSLTIPVESDCWDIVTGKIKPQRSIPLIDVLTVAATGTEMNMFAVVQNNKTREKLGYSNSLIYPKFSFLDPQAICQINRHISHCLCYF